ncbi:MAG: carboxypeptidase-like regulatory domain-containing protein, partial [Planctomycetota bacterium]
GATRKIGGDSPVEPDGSFLLLVPPGPVEINIHVQGFQDRRLQPLELEPGEEWNLGDVQISRGHVLTGVVLSQGGEPIPGASIEAGPRKRTHTSGAGHFELSGLDSATQDIEIEAKWYANRTLVAARASPTPVEIRLEEIGRLHPRTFREDGTAWRMTRNGGFHEFKAVACDDRGVEDPDRTFKSSFFESNIMKLRPGRYRIYLERGAESLAGEIARVEAGKTVKAVVTVR